MKSVYIFRHIKNEGPGYLAEFLNSHRIPQQLVRIDQDEPFPKSLDHVSGLVFMGGTMSVNDSLPWIPRALQVIQTAYRKKIPVLGHCLGGQLMAKALGAEITRNPVPEFGWHDVEISPETEPGDWVKDLPGHFPAFHWHNETFGLPDGSVRILENEHCLNQGFVYQNSLALQCHIEMTKEMVNDWLAHSLDSLPRSEIPSVQDPPQMLEQLNTRLDKMQRAANVLYGHWIKGLV